jgi:hypothetical protein
MRQQTLASQASFEKFGRKGKRELFLDQMEQVVPWAALLELIEPHYPRAGNGRQPVGLVDHAADLLFAAVVQPVGPRNGRSLL